MLSAQTQLMSTRCQNSRLKSEIRNYVEKNPHATHFHPKLYFDDVEQKTGVFILFKISSHLILFLEYQCKHHKVILGIIRGVEKKKSAHVYCSKHIICKQVQMWVLLHIYWCLKCTKSGC